MICDKCQKKTDEIYIMTNGLYCNTCRGGTMFEGLMDNHQINLYKQNGEGITTKTQYNIIILEEY